MSRVSQLCTKTFHYRSNLSCSRIHKTFIPTFKTFNKLSTKVYLDRSGQLQTIELLACINISQLSTTAMESRHALNSIDKHIE